MRPPARAIITRGVLLDLPRLRGVDWLDPAEPVMPEDLEAAEQAQGVRLEQGRHTSDPDRQLPYAPGKRALLSD